MTRRKITFPAGDQNLIILGVASLFTDWIIPTDT
jgi:hypothetical protein